LAKKELERLIFARDCWRGKPRCLRYLCQTKLLRARTD
jgi:hypothetical protein